MPTSLLRDVEVELLLAETEAELILAEAAAGESVTNAIRPLNKAERRAKMRFGEIEKIEAKAASEAAEIIAEIAQAYIRAVIGEFFGGRVAVDSATLAAKLTSINASIPHAAKDSMTAAAGKLGRIFEGVHTAASEIAIGEARRQGVTGLPEPLTPTPGRFDPFGQAVALQVWNRITGRLQADYLNPSALRLAELTRDDFEAAAGKISLDGGLDLARQSIHSAHGAGRIETAEILAPTEVYSSELMDGATCGPCARVDGKDYDDLIEAKTEYETGGYGACAGGARCRGTLVFIYPPGHKPDLPELEPLDPAPAPKTKPRAKPKPKAEPAPEPVEPDDGPAVPLPKRAKGTTQRYTALNQLPKPDPALSKLSPLEHARRTNPGRASGTKLYSNNCTSVVTAYEMRRRGIDVLAAPVKGGKGRYDNEFVQSWWRKPDGSVLSPTWIKDLGPTKATHFEGKKILPGGSIEARVRMEETLLELPDGARGGVILEWSRGGGHVFNWEKVGGKIAYYEGQIPTQPDASGHVAAGKFKPRSLRFYRMDDATLTDAAAVAFETRPATLAAELADKAAKAAARAADPNRKPTAAEMKAQSRGRWLRHPNDDLYFESPKYYRSGGKWVPVPEEEQAKIKAEMEANVLKMFGNMKGRRA